MIQEHPDERTALIEKIVNVDRKVYRAFYAASARAWLEVDVTMPQLKILFLLYHEGQVKMGQLANALGVRLPTATGTIDRLVEQGLVVRDEDPADRRLVIVRLTDKGHQIIDRLHEAGRSGVAGLLQGLNVDELRVVAQAMDIIQRGLSQ